MQFTIQSQLVYAAESIQCKHTIKEWMGTCNQLDEVSKNLPLRNSGFLLNAEGRFYTNTVE